MTSEVLKKLRLHNVINNRTFYQDQLINEHARKKENKKSQSQSVLVRYRRTLVLNNLVYQKALILSFKTIFFLLKTNANYPDYFTKNFVIQIISNWHIF